MDPTELLRMMREALDVGDTETASNYANSLDNWLSRGGFLPDQWLMYHHCTRPEVKAARVRMSRATHGKGH
jgi:hypothetical protein